MRGNDTVEHEEIQEVQEYVPCKVKEAYLHRCN